MLIDYHIHNHFSPDSDSDTKAIIQKAQKKNLDAIAITNHTEWFEEGEGISGRFKPERDIERFRKAEKEIKEIREDFPSVQVAFGAELQYEEGNMDNLTNLVEITPFDFILGSVHNVDGINISGNKHIDDFLRDRTEEEAYTLYFEDMLKLVEWGHVDVIAHFDIIKKYSYKKYGPFQPEKHKLIIQKVLQKMKEKGIGIELNTGSLHKNCEELFPHPEILKWCLEIGVEHFTFGSDAHSINGIARHFDEVLKIAKDVGIITLSTYEKREPTKHKLK